MNRALVIGLLVVGCIEAFSCSKRTATARNEGEPCGLPDRCAAGLVCVNGACTTGCLIDAIYYAAAAANSADACQLCDPTQSADAWSYLQDGESCGSGQVCSAGVCQAGCWIDGAPRADGEVSVANVCRGCIPALATADWSDLSDGTACGDGKVCATGRCELGCIIDSTLYASGATLDQNVCQVCRPAWTTSAWSKNDDGMSCGDARVCYRGACESGCWVRDQYWPAEGNSYMARWFCQECIPSVSTSQFTSLPDGTVCGMYEVGECRSWGCLSGCRADGLWFQQGEIYPQNSCLVCAYYGHGHIWQNLPCVTSLAAGTSHSCANPHGGAQCWGGNDAGQLGNGSTTQTARPVQVQGLSSNVSTIAAGDRYSCAIVNGGVWCWGKNAAGQLGDGSTSEQHTPVAIPSLTTAVSALTAGRGHACAIVGGGAVCWGANSSGQIGDGSTTDRQAPVAVTGLSSNVVAIAAGYGHTCAVVNGAVLCWGANADGQLGDTTRDASAVPVPVSGLTSSATAVATGFGHSCAIANNGVFCWGANDQGQLGDGTTAGSAAALHVMDLGANNNVVAGANYTCAFDQPNFWTGRAYCWGANSRGQLGDGSTTERRLPVGTDVSSCGYTGPAGGPSVMATGAEHTCAVQCDHGVACWGNGQQGQLGSGSLSDVSSSSAVLVPFL